MYTSTVNDQIFIEKKNLKIKLEMIDIVGPQIIQKQNRLKNQLFLIYSNFQSIEVDCINLSK